MNDNELLEFASRLKGKKRFYEWTWQGRTVSVSIIIEDMVNGIPYDQYIQNIYWQWKAETNLLGDVNDLIKYFREHGIWCEK